MALLVEAADGSRCPFAARNSQAAPSSSPRGRLVGKKRVILLYEHYIHLFLLQEVWDHPLMERPQLEPCFAAAMHAMELCFLIMTQSLNDERTYVAKRPRIELVANDIVRQCDLLAELVDGELEEDHPINTPRILSSLTQDFPFEGCPPTTTHEACHSPSLEMLYDAICISIITMTTSEQTSLRKVIQKITNAFESNFRNWSVGIGIEGQLNQLREVVGLPRIASFDTRTLQLDYKALVRPEVVTSTYTDRSYKHVEDFFFRSVHLGTECWAFIIIRRLESAKKLAEKKEWHNAAARVRQAAHIFSYLGEHILMLTSMVLRDYLALKVEIEGTSGEGSLQVKSFRGLVKGAFEPLKTAVLGWHATEEGNIINLPIKDDGKTDDDEEKEEEEKAQRLKEALLELYDSPEKNPGAYNYAKALEYVESALLGGFYFSHYRLAANVIGLGAKGTMNRAVKALKATYETSVFPLLDSVRSTLGDVIDNRLAHLKGLIMSDIEESHSPGMDS